MRFAQITLENGHSWGTSINGTNQEICEYFLGKFWQFCHDENKTSRCCKVVIDDKETFRRERFYFVPFIARFVPFLQAQKDNMQMLSILTGFFVDNSVKKQASGKTEESERFLNLARGILLPLGICLSRSEGQLYPQIICNGETFELISKAIAHASQTEF